MRYCMQVGKVQYDIQSTFPLPWRESDLSFRDVTVPPAVICPVSVRETERIAGEADVVYQEGRIAVLAAPDGSQIRTYRAMYAKDRPVFARSTDGPDGIVIEALLLRDIWSNSCVSVWSLLHLENHLLDAGGLILHCCYLKYRGGAILFTAPSGTGKTTQGELWERVFGADIINGDKALLQHFGGEWNAWGYPFHGSAPECKNERYPIRAIVALRQAEYDKAETLTASEAFVLLYEGITVNVWDRERTSRAADLLQDVIANVPVVRLDCTMRESAAQALHRYLYGY